MSETSFKFRMKTGNGSTTTTLLNVVLLTRTRSALPCFLDFWLYQVSKTGSWHEKNHRHFQIATSLEWMDWQTDWTNLYSCSPRLNLLKEESVWRRTLTLNFMSTITLYVIVFISLIVNVKTLHTRRSAVAATMWHRHYIKNKQSSMYNVFSKGSLRALSSSLLSWSWMRQQALVVVGLLRDGKR